LYYRQLGLSKAEPNLLLGIGVKTRGGVAMDLKFAISIIGNFALIAGLAISGFHFFAEYHATGKWAKNVTGLLAGLGLLTLAFALMITPANAEVIAQIAQTKASVVFLTISSGLLLAAITAFGIITYSKPLRLLHQRRIQRDLNRDLPKIP
jgi:hypothetical protein